MIVLILLILAIPAAFVFGLMAGIRTKREPMQKKPSKIWPVNTWRQRIRIESMRAATSFLSDYPCMIFEGPLLTNTGREFKNGKRGKVWQMHIKEGNEMKPQEQNAMIARWMGWAIGEHHTPETPSGKPWVYAGKVYQSPPDYTNDLNALGEVLERIRKTPETGIEINVTTNGKWAVEIETPHPYEDCYMYPNGSADTEQAAKVVAIIEFIKAQKGGDHE